MDIEDSDEEQSLQGFKTNIFNKLSPSSTQTTITPTLPRAEHPKTIITPTYPKEKQPEQPIADQTTEHTTRPVLQSKILQLLQSK